MADPVSAPGSPIWQEMLTLLTASIVGPVAAVRLGLPGAVVLILLGVGLGPAGVGVIQDGPIVAFLSHFGFLVLMFIAGMEIDFTAIRVAGRAALLWPSLLVGGVCVSAALSAWLCGLSGVIALCVGAMSVGMPMAVLKETALDSAPIGRRIMLTTSIGEFVCILGITGMEVIASGPFGLHTLVRVGKVTALFVICAAVIRWARALVWWYPAPIKRLIEHGDVAELGVRVGLVIMLAFVALSALAGVEPILGAFTGGALVSVVLRQKHALELKIGAIGNGLLIPIFFIVVGVRFNPWSLDFRTLQQAAYLAALSGLSKLLPSLVFAPPGTALRERVAAGLLISAPLTLVVAIAAIGRELRLLDDRAQASLVLVAMLVSILFPVGFKLLAPRPSREPIRPPGT